MKPDNESVTITAVWLRTLSNRLIVEVEIGGRWYTAIEETTPPIEFTVSHIAEARGKDRWKLSEMN